MHTAELRTPQWVEQARNGAAELWTPQCVEQAGKGGKRKSGRLTWLTPSAPLLSRHTKHSGGTIESQRGRARNYSGEASNFPLATLPSLFNPLW